MSIYVGNTKLIRLLLLNKLEESQKLRRTGFRIFDFQSQFSVSNYWLDLLKTIMGRSLSNKNGHF